MKPEAALKKLPAQVVLIALWVAWLGYAWLPQPLVIDEVVFAQIAHAPFGEFGHPPGYLHALGLFAAIFKLPDIWLRLVGVIALLATGFAAYRLAQRLQQGAGLWALFLLFTNPLALRGAFVMDIDNTLLMAWVAWSVCWLAHVRWPLNRRAIVAFGFWWALGLWLKLTTPWIWPVAFAAAFAARGEGKQGLKSAALMAGTGLLVFLSAWALYSRLAHVPWNAIFGGRIVSMILRGASDKGSVLFVELAERAARIGLWVGFPLIILWAAATVHWLRFRRQLPSPEGWAAILVFGWVMLLGYWIIGGVIWSFARYHSPCVPLISSAAAALIARELKGVRFSAGLAVLSVLIVVLLVLGVIGDPLYQVNYTLRHATLFDPTRIRPILLALAIGQGSLALLITVLAGLFRKNRPAGLSQAGAILMALAFGSMGSGIGLAICQRGASYMTSYCYGRPWRTFLAIRQQALQFHQANPDMKIMAAFDTFQGQVPFDEFLKVFDNEWYAVESKAKFLNTLADPRLGLCVLDADFSASFAVKSIWFSDEVKALLAREFVPIKLGTAQGWIRKNRMGSM